MLLSTAGGSSGWRSPPPQPPSGQIQTGPAGRRWRRRKRSERISHRFDSDNKDVAEVPFVKAMDLPPDSGCWSRHRPAVKNCTATNRGAEAYLLVLSFISRPAAAAAAREIFDCMLHFTGYRNWLVLQQVCRVVLDKGRRKKKHDRLSQN